MDEPESPSPPPATSPAPPEAQSDEAAPEPDPAPAEMALAAPPADVMPAPIAAPKPKPIIIPERVADGWQTPSLHLRRAAAGFYLTLHPERGRSAPVIHLTLSQLEGLFRRIDAEQGLLWRALSEIPLERPLPSRALEDELRSLLRTFGNELRSRVV
jgi:hypothetical protein